MILYYTHNAKPRGFMERCYNHHREQAERLGQQFVAVVKERFKDDDIIMEFDPDPKYADIYRRIMRGLDGIPDDEPVYLAEDDTLYPDCRYEWEFVERLTVIYNLNLCYLGPHGYSWYMRGGIALSQLMGPCSAVRYNIGLKLNETLNHEMACIEPCSGPNRSYISATCMTPVPSVDFRTDYNASWKLPTDIEFFNDLDGWPTAQTMWKQIYEGGN